MNLGGVNWKRISANLCGIWQTKRTVGDSCIFNLHRERERDAHFNFRTTACHRQRSKRKRKTQRPTSADTAPPLTLLYKPPAAPYSALTISDLTHQSSSSGQPSQPRFLASVAFIFSPQTQQTSDGGDEDEAVLRRGGSHHGCLSRREGGGR